MIDSKFKIEGKGLLNTDSMMNRLTKCKSMKILPHLPPALIDKLNSLKLEDTLQVKPALWTPKESLIKRVKPASLEIKVKDETTPGSWLKLLSPDFQQTQLLR